MNSIDLDYALPASRLRVDSKVAVVNDTLLGGEPRRSTESTVSLEVGATARNLTLQASTGWFLNTSVSLKLTNEGRLTSSDMETTGQAGTVVLGVVGAAIGLASMTVSPALGTLRLARKAELAFAMERMPLEVERTPEDIEAEAFAREQPDAAALRAQYAGAVAASKQAIASLAMRLADDENGDDESFLFHRLRRLQEQLPPLQAELDRLNGVFAAWRSSKLEKRVEEHELLIPIDDIRAAEATISDGNVCFGKDAPPGVLKAWKELGVAFRVEPIGEVADDAASAARRTDSIAVRVPRLATVSVYAKDGSGKAVLRESKPHLIMDSACQTRTVKLRKSAWAKRSVSLGFDEIGALTSYEVGADSAAAAAATTAGKVPATAREAIEEGTKARTQLAELSRSGLAEELAQVKLEVELREKQLARNGIAATAAEHAELQRLKQQAEILEQQKKIREAAG